MLRAIQAVGFFTRCRPQLGDQADGLDNDEGTDNRQGDGQADRLQLGQDQAGVADSEALGGAALTVGKYLSPRLLLSYGVSLFGEGQVVSLNYLINEAWNLQLDASPKENRGSINYRRER